MSDGKDAIALMTSFVRGEVSVIEFGKKYLSLWCELQDSGQAARENIYVQRGLDVVFTALDDANSQGRTWENQASVLFAEVRAVLSVIAD